MPTKTPTRRCNPPLPFHPKTMTPTPQNPRPFPTLTRATHNLQHRSPTKFSTTISNENPNTLDYLLPQHTAYNPRSLATHNKNLQTQNLSTPTNRSTPPKFLLKRSSLSLALPLSRALSLSQKQEPRDQTSASFDPEAAEVDHQILWGNRRKGLQRVWER